jgi:hypothetical protein
MEGDILLLAVKHLITSIKSARPLDSHLLIHVCMEHDMERIKSKMERDYEP